MNFDRLRYLAAVARTGSVRGAAVALHVTPGAVSKALARLEEEVGSPVLVQVGRGVELTDEGRWLAQRAEHLVGEFASIGADLERRRGRVAEMCLATYDAFAAWLPGPLSRQFLPGVPLSVRERWPGEVEAAVASCVSDVGVTFIPVATDGVEHVEVARVPLGVYAARGAFEGVPLARLPFAVPSHPVSGAVGDHGPLDGWPADAAPREVRIRASSLEARLDVARAGEAAIVLPHFVAARHNAAHLAGQRLHPWEGRGVPARLARRVYVVRRVGASPQMAQRVESVIAAVRALCTT
jgi:DNA-binding transcriptional LysR family regulator